MLSEIHIDPYRYIMLIHFRLKKSMDNKRHVKSVKIGASLFFVTMVSYSPIVFGTITGVPYPGYLFVVIYVNNFVNFFVYFWIDKNFRKWILLKFWKN